MSQLSQEMERKREERKTEERACFTVPRVAIHAVILQFELFHSVIQHFSHSEIFATSFAAGIDSELCIVT